MSNDKIKNKTAPKIFEKAVLVLIGVFSLIFVPFCILVSLALLSSTFGAVTSKYQLPIYYSLSVATLFAFLALLLAVVGWRLIRSKQAESENLLAPFRIWFRRLAWLFVCVLTVDGIITMVKGNANWVAKAIIAVILVIVIKKGNELKEYFDWSAAKKDD